MPRSRACRTTEIDSCSFLPVDWPKRLGPPQPRPTILTFKPLRPRLVYSTCRPPLFLRECWEQSGRRRASLLSSPLRTVLDTFASYGSSRSLTSLPLLIVVNLLMAVQVYQLQVAVGIFSPILLWYDMVGV